MLTEICADLRNYFCSDADKHIGTYKISGRSLAPLDFLKDGQYYRIVGSTFNDGVHQHPDPNLIDEEFQGAVWAMKVPKEVVALAEKAKEFNDKYSPGGFVSESFAGYSYTRATGKNGMPLGWQEAFSGELNRWRKL